MVFVGRSNWQVYTGTSTQPDVATVFLKSGNRFEFYDEDSLNSIGYDPRDFKVGIQRFSYSARTIISEFNKNRIFQKKSQLFNACMNLFRGMVECVPLLGSGSLYCYDTLRKIFYIHPLIKNALSQEKKVVLGIAFDGKVVLKAPVSVVRSGLKLHHHSIKSEKGQTAIFNLFSYLWLAAKCKRLEKNPLVTSDRIVHQIKTRFLKI